MSFIWCPKALLLGLLTLASVYAPAAALACETQGPQQARLPQWLLAEPPVGVLLMDNGEIITLGRPGCLARLRAAAAQDLPLPEDAGRFFRFNAEGELLAELPDGIHWWVHYWPDYESVVQRWAAEGAGPGEYRGLLIFEYADGRRAALYRYDGTPLERTAELDSFPPGYTWISGEEVEGLSRDSKRSAPH